MYEIALKRNHNSDGYAEDDIDRTLDAVDNAFAVIAKDGSLN